MTQTAQATDYFCTDTDKSSCPTSPGGGFWLGNASNNHMVLDTKNTPYTIKTIRAGRSQNGDNVIDNSIKILSGTVDGRIYGGVSVVHPGLVARNKVIVGSNSGNASDITIYGTAQGGHSFSNFGGGTSYDANENEVHILSGTFINDPRGSNIVGGTSGRGHANSNKIVLNIGSGVSADNIFEVIGGNTGTNGWHAKNNTITIQGGDGSKALTPDTT